MSNPNVLTGRQTNTLYGGNPNQQQPGAQQPQQTQQQNPLAAMSQMAARFSGNGNGQGTNASLYNFTGANKNGHMTGLFALEEGVAEEQIKTQALFEGGHYGNSVATVLLRRVAKHSFYHSLQAAMDRFKCPIKGGNQEQGFVDFVNELTYNQAAYNFVGLQIGIQYGIEFAMAITSGDDRLRDPNSRDLQVSMVYRIACDTIWLQYLDWLSINPEGNQLFYRLSNTAKEVAMKNDKSIAELALHRYTWAGLQCPWRGGRLTELQGRTHASNPILDVANPLDLGLGGMFVNPNSPLTGNDQNVDQEGMREMYAYINRTAAETQAARMQPAYQQRSTIPAVEYNNIDKPELKLSDITLENRTQYRLANYGVQVPGTEWWIIKNEDMQYIGRALRLSDGSTLRLLDTRCIGTVPVYRIDWHAGRLEYKLVPHKLQMVDVMEALISDPSKLLPYMYEEDGTQKHTFDMTVLETNKFVNNGVIIPVGEVKELEREPNVLVGSKAVDLTRENSEIMSIMSTLVAKHDPKDKLDAFVLPTTINRNFKLEDDTNMDSFYESFGRMVKGGNKGLKDTGRVLRSIRVALLDYQGTEFADFVVPYVTNLFNRFLIETRGYCETRAEFEACNRESPFLRSTNVFDDLEDIIEMLRDHDPATLVAFNDLETNEFFLNGLEILLPQEKAKSKLEHGFSKEDESLLPALQATAEKTIVMSRETVLIEAKSQQGPRQTEQVIIKQSGNPMLFALIRQSLNITGKHFAVTPQILIRFGNDEHGKVWVVTPSALDPNNVIHLRVVDNHCSFAHPYPIVE